MKQCSHPDCNFPVFSKGLCMRHWKMQWGKPPKRTALKKHGGSISKISKTKKKQDEEYKKVCDELDAEARAEKRWICFFCYKSFHSPCDHHHVAGKQGLSDNGISLFLDKKGIVLCHRKCHREYHDITIEKLLKAPYYSALMEKIYYVCRARYYDMKAKHDEHLNKKL